MEFSRPCPTLARVSLGFFFGSIGVVAGGAGGGKFLGLGRGGWHGCVGVLRFCGSCCGCGDWAVDGWELLFFFVVVVWIGVIEMIRILSKGVHVVMGILGAVAIVMSIFQSGSWVLVGGCYLD